MALQRELVGARTGNGQLRLSRRELADVERLMDALTKALRRRLPIGLEVVELELELARRPRRTRSSGHRHARGGRS
jgi:hypothetical protein